MSSGSEGQGMDSEEKIDERAARAERRSSLSPWRSVVAPTQGVDSVPAHGVGRPPDPTPGGGSAADSVRAPPGSGSAADSVRAPNLSDPDFLVDAFDAGLASYDPSVAGAILGNALPLDSSILLEPVGAMAERIGSENSADASVAGTAIDVETGSTNSGVSGGSSLTPSSTPITQEPPHPLAGESNLSPGGHAISDHGRNFPPLQSSQTQQAINTAQGAYPLTPLGPSTVVAAPPSLTVVTAAP